MGGIEEIRLILPVVLKNFQEPEKQIRNRLVSLWPNIAGERLAKRTRPSLSSKGVLYVYVDEAVLAYEISQKYRASFLKRARAALGEKAVKDIKIRVGK
ncbi:MAG: DUF721 domain-containing protein [Candidatus Omnitrophica bacterium]|nr:DUF721 domain-containing protein [Candidatus Omnitrophota bacterium]